MPGVAFNRVGRTLLGLGCVTGVTLLGPFHIRAARSPLEVSEPFPIRFRRLIGTAHESTLQIAR
jgi:hypothetical protein